MSPVVGKQNFEVFIGGSYARLMEKSSPALLRFDDFLVQPGQISSGHASQARLLSHRSEVRGQHTSSFELRRGCGMEHLAVGSRGIDGKSVPWFLEVLRCLWPCSLPCSSKFLRRNPA